MQIIRFDGYRKEGAAIVRPSPSVLDPAKDKTERHHRHRLWREVEAVVRQHCVRCLRAVYTESDGNQAGLTASEH